MTTTQSKFDALVGKTEDDLKLEGIAIARRMLSRKFASAYDDALGQVIKTEHEITSMFNRIARTPESGVKSFDVNQYVELITQKRSLELIAEQLKAEFVALFGVPMPEVG